MASDPVTGENGKKETPKQKRRAQIMVGAAVLGVVLTAILVMRSRSSSAASSGGTSAVPFDPTGGYTAGYPTGGYGGSQGSPGVSGGGGFDVGSVLPSATGPQYSAQDVQNLAAQLGVPLAWGNESAQQRVSRIVQQLNATNGAQRPWSDVVTGFQWEATQLHPSAQSHPQTVSQPVQVTVHAPALTSSATHPPVKGVNA